jgi:hypothetical protein
MKRDTDRARMRIIHIEDEWNKWTSIPHHLFDRLFDHLRPRPRIDLEFEEIQRPMKLSPYSFYAFQNKERKDAYFSYSFLLDARRIDSIALDHNDIVILDIMKPNDKGLLVPAVSQLLQGLRKRKFPIEERCRYFSAFPGELPAGTDFKGFSKGESSELVGYIFEFIKMSIPK